MMLWGNDVKHPSGSYGLFLYNNGSTNLALHRSFHSNHVSTKHDLRNKEWMLFTMTFDGTSARLYVNGVLEGTAATYLSFTEGNAEQFVISNLAPGSAQYSLGGASGRYSNFTFWNDKVLTVEEITILYNKGNPTNVF